MKLRRINEVTLTAPKVDATSYEQPDVGAKGMKFDKGPQVSTPKDTQSPSDSTQGTSPIPRTLSLIKSVVKEHINNTLGNLAARETSAKKRRRPLASATKIYGRYKAMKEETDKAEETEERAIVKPKLRKVPGPNLEPENLSIQ